VPENRLSYAGRRFGTLLVESGIVDEAGLAKALERQRTTGERLGEALVGLGLATEPEIVRALSEQLDIPTFNLARVTAVEPEVILTIPEHMARHHVALAVELDGGVLTVAMANPLDLVAIDDIRVATGKTIKPEVGSRSEIEEAIATAYRSATAGRHMEEVIAGAKLQLETESATSAGEMNEEELRNRAEDAPIVRLVNLVLSQALAERATDIHIEPLPDRTVVRYRVDGMLYDSATPPKDFHEAIVVRIKILSDMDVSERRVPLDGRFTLSFDGRAVDVRVSTLPTVYGEKVAMRLLDKSGGTVRLEDLGFEPEMLETYLRGIRRPYGMVLVSGPTGSGKTSTLYSGMKELDRVGKNITTLEDPVEYHLERINQVTINRKAGLTFGTGLRSLLRQDPDVIMIGEIRDLETAELAVRSALTGHLVLSTVHANDAPATATRLVDIGIEPYLVASAVHLVMAQRLVRKICPDCATKYEPDPSVVRALGEADLRGTTFLQGAGCKQCRGRGFRGRTAVFELLDLSPELGDMVIARASADAVRRRAVELGFVTLRQNAITKVKQGITTVEEALSVCTELI